MRRFRYDISVNNNNFRFICGLLVVKFSCQFNSFLVYHIIILCSFSFSATLTIPTDYPTIQSGIDASISGDTVLVNSGTYFENIDFLGKNISVMSVEGPQHTIIDGYENGSVVRITSEVDSTALLKGFTLQHGRATIGSGLYIHHSNPTIQQLIFRENYLDIPLDYTFSIIGIENNFANIDWKFVQLSDIEIYDIDYGFVGLSIHVGNAILNHVLIVENSPMGHFCGIYADFSSVEVNNSTISGGSFGIYLLDSKAITNNSIITSNDNWSIAFGLSFNEEYYYWGSYYLESTYTLFTNTFYNLYINSNIQNRIDYNEGTIFGTPLFLNVYEEDYRLSPFSPAIDNGNPANGLDPDGTPPDIGYYYYDQIIDDFLYGDVNLDGALNVIDIVMIVEFIVETPGTEYEMLISDYLQDGGVDVLDIVALVTFILGI